jgi:hypothetical protein
MVFPLRIGGVFTLNRVSPLWLISFYFIFHTSFITSYTNQTISTRHRRRHSSNQSPNRFDQRERGPNQAHHVPDRDEIKTKQWIESRPWQKPPKTYNPYAHNTAGWRRQNKYYQIEDLIVKGKAITWTNNNSEGSRSWERGFKIEGNQAMFSTSELWTTIYEKELQEKLPPERGQGTTRESSRRWVARRHWR